MLVPSTFTGWYKKRMTRIARTTDMKRSRIQFARTVIADRWLSVTGFSSLAAAGSIGPVAGNAILIVKHEDRFQNSSHHTRTQRGASNRYYTWENTGGVV